MNQSDLIRYIAFGIVLAIAILTTFKIGYDYGKFNGMWEVCEVEGDGVYRWQIDNKWHCNKPPTIKDIVDGGADWSINLPST